MKRLARQWLWLLVIVLVCGAWLQEGRKAEAQEARAIQPIHADVKYGPSERNVLDFYPAKSEQPTPLTIYIHGGGFVGGNKNVAPAQVRAFHAAEISVAAIHYRFVDGKQVIFPTPQHDGARAVQFLRSKARKWNIDPKRVACFGGSAGAGISMWIGFHEDLADLTSDDPIQRESTRIQAVGTFGGQSTYDPIEIKRLIGGRAWEHPSIFKVYASACSSLEFFLTKHIHSNGLNRIWMLRRPCRPVFAPPNLRL